MIYALIIFKPTKTFLYHTHSTCKYTEEDKYTEDFDEEPKYTEEFEEEPVSEAVD